LLNLQAILGIVIFIAIAVAFSEKRKVPNWKLLAVGLGLQFLIAFVVFRVEMAQQLLGYINGGVAAIVSATEAGSLFLFGYLGGDPANIDYPFMIDNPTATMILAFRVLPLILMFTVLSAILWYYRILPLIVRGFSFLLRRSMDVSGAVGLSAAANIFIGMVESPTLIRPLIKELTRSELFIVMTCGMATIAGSVMIFYSVILQNVLDNPLAHILTASVISAPAAIMLALIMVPASLGRTEHTIKLDTKYHSLMDVISRSNTDGLKLMVNVGAMILVLIALVSLLNSLLSIIPFPGTEPLSLQGIFSYIFSPLAWLMGIPWAEAQVAGSLMGLKTALNELIAFLALSELPAGVLSERSATVMTYALCGFANFGSLGIMIAGIVGMCPERRIEIVELAPRSLISGTLATCMTGSIAGLLL
jgi:concentrative nucleoside transporter, CNT family